MAWVVLKTWVANTRLYDADINAQLRDNLNETMPAKATAAGQIFASTGLNAIAARDIQIATASGSVTATVAQYLTKTGGPTITTTTGSRALAIYGANISSDGVGGAQMTAGWYNPGFGAYYSLQQSAARGSGFPFRVMSAHLFTDLPPGSNTFTCYYMRINFGSGTATFSDRYLIVIAL